MKYKAVIFDMDGLIVDTEIIEHRSFEILLKEYGVEPRPNPNGLIQEIGGGSTYYQTFKDRHNLNEELEVIRIKKREIFEKIILEENITPMKGFFYLIKLLRENNYRIALASNRVEKSIHLILDKIEALDQFDVLVGPNLDQERRHKPHPDIYLHTAKELKIDPRDCIVLEDSLVGVISAKAAGMKVIAVPNSYSKDHDFSRADVVVNSLSDINIKLLESIS